MHAIDALRAFMPGCEDATLRNFGMTIGIRDTRKIDALYDLTEHDVREQARFDDSIGIFPEFIDGYGILILPTTGRYFQVPYRSLVPEGVGRSDRCRPLDRRRQGLARVGSEHDVLHCQLARVPVWLRRSRSGRTSRSTGWTSVGPGGAQAPGRAHPLRLALRAGGNPRSSQERDRHERAGSHTESTSVSEGGLVHAHSSKIRSGRNPSASAPRRPCAAP